jgi:hypothetical protein
MVNFEGWQGSNDMMLITLRGDWTGQNRLAMQIRGAVEVLLP